MKFWLGSEESFLDYREKIELFNKKLINGSASKLRASLREEDDDEDEYMGNPVGYQVEGSVALITIEGGTLEKSSMLSRFFGMASYEDIAGRMDKAVADENIKTIVLNINSGGGQASGAFELADQIREVNNNIKPVVSVNNGDMGSAAYLYGSSASMIVSTNRGMTGSIGAIMIHTESSKMREREGLTTTVFRTSPHKALVNGIEPLNDKAKEIVMEDMNFLHDSFVAALAENRGVAKDYVQENYATGLMYRAPEALKIKLIDKIGSLQEVVAKLNTKPENSATR